MAEIKKRIKARLAETDRSVLKDALRAIIDLEAQLAALEEKPVSTSGMKVSNKGIKEIKNHEGVRHKPYRDPVGFWTVGVGHLITKKKQLPPEWNKTLTTKEVNSLLRQDLDRFEKCVNKACPNDLAQPRFDAMVSLAFNIGELAFKRSSICRKHNQRDFMGAANAFRLYRKAGGKVLQGLVDRRERERLLYLS